MRKEMQPTRDCASALNILSFRTTLRRIAVGTNAGGASPFLPHPTDAGDEQSRCGGGRPAPGKERTVVSVAGDFSGPNAWSISCVR